MTLHHGIVDVPLWFLPAARSPELQEGLDGEAGAGAGEVCPPGQTAGGSAPPGQTAGGLPGPGDRSTNHHSLSMFAPEINFRSPLFSSSQWRKFWFVLSADSLRYYRDSIAEEVCWVCLCVYVYI